MKKVVNVSLGGRNFILNEDAYTRLQKVASALGMPDGSAGFWIYVILWIAVPKADTPAKKYDCGGRYAVSASYDDR